MCVEGTTTIIFNLFFGIILSKWNKSNKIGFWRSYYNKNLWIISCIRVFWDYMWDWWLFVSMDHPDSTQWLGHLVFSLHYHFKHATHANQRLNLWAWMECLTWIYTLCRQILYYTVICIKSSWNNSFIFIKICKFAHKKKCEWPKKDVAKLKYVSDSVYLVQ